MNDNKWQHDQARLDEMQLHMQRRLDEQQARVARRIVRVQDRINRRYGKAPLTGDMQARIIRAGLELLKEEGLDKLSLRHLAQKVNVQAPALYWYFKDKATLVDYLAEGILQAEFGNSFAPRRTGQPWEEWFTQTMNRLRNAMLAFPDGARVVAGAHLYPAETLAQLIDYSIQSLTSSGISLEETRTIHMTALTYTFGFVIEEQSSPRPDELIDFDIFHTLSDYPYLKEMVATIDMSTEASSRQYEAGLAAIIRGSSSRS